MNERFEAGRKVRREVLGDDYVDAALETDVPFERAFQEFVTEHCWGNVWADETLTRRERSLLTLGMVAALGRMNEFGLHSRGALTNGITEEEIAAVLRQIAIYCGVPIAVSCFTTLRELLGDEAPNAKTQEGDPTEMDAGEIRNEEV